MTRQLMLRLLDTFFRRWWLYIVPLVLLVGLGFMKVSNTTDSYRSVGTLNVEGNTVLGDLSDVRGDTGTFGSTPAQTTSQQLGSYLSTESFVQRVVDGAGLRSAVDSGAVTLAQVRQAITSGPAGTNLVKVGATFAYPDVAQRLAASTLTTFVDWVTELKVTQSTAAEKFYGDQLPGLDQQATAARNALTDYLNQNPVPAGAARPDVQQAEVTRLTAAVTQAQDRYNTALGKQEDARLQGEQARADVKQKLNVVDEPDVPIAPEPKLKQAVFGFGGFVVIGLLLTLATVVVGSVLDHTIRFADEVREPLGLRVLAVVPEAPVTRRARQNPPPPPTEQPATARALQLELASVLSPRPAAVINGDAAPAAATNGDAAPAAATNGETAPAATAAPTASRATPSRGKGDEDGGAAAGHDEQAHRQHQRRRTGGTRPSFTLKQPK